MRLSIFASILLLASQVPTATKKQQEQTREQDAVVQASPTPSVPVTVIVNQPTSPEKINKSNDKSHEWIGDLINLALVGVACWGATIANRSLRAIESQATSTEKAANAARDNAQAVINAERARVDIFFHQFSATEYELRLINFGKSYAIITKHVLIHAHLTQKEFNELPKRIEANEEWGVRELHNTYSILPADGVPKPAIEFQITNYLHEREDGIVDLFGARIEYDDIFDQSHETEIVYRVNLDLLTKLPMLVHIPDLTNYT